MTFFAPGLRAVKILNLVLFQVAESAGNNSIEWTSGDELNVARPPAEASLGGAMRTTWTAEKCLERACRLLLMADRANDYELILTYEELAQEWLRLAARAGRECSGPVQTAPSPRRRFEWRALYGWFR